MSSFTKSQMKFITGRGVTLPLGTTKNVTLYKVDQEVKPGRYGKDWTMWKLFFRDNATDDAYMGTFPDFTGEFKSFQAAVNAAEPAVGQEVAFTIITGQEGFYSAKFTPQVPSEVAEFVDVVASGGSTTGSTTTGPLTGRPRPAHFTEAPAHTVTTGPVSCATEGPTAAEIAAAQRVLNAARSLKSGATTVQEIPF